MYDMCVKFAYDLHSLINSIIDFQAMVEVGATQATPLKQSVSWLIPTFCWEGLACSVAVATTLGKLRYVWS